MSTCGADIGYRYDHRLRAKDVLTSSITQIPKGIARDLGLSGRDTLRGVRSTLAPAKALLAEPVRFFLQRLDASVTPSGVLAGLTLDANFFSGNYEDSMQFALVAHAGLTEIRRLMQRDHLMVSETVLVLASRRAACLCANIPPPVMPPLRLQKAS